METGGKNIMSDSDNLKIFWFILLISMAGGVGMGLVASTGFVWWISCLWGFGTYIGSLGVCFGAWAFANSITRENNK